MLQLTQKLGSGEMMVQDVPQPQLGPGMILVKNHFSIISAGTEGSTVNAARKSLIGKARERPQQVKQVLDSLKKLGPTQTLRAVNKKLDAYSPLGYSCAGEVIDVASGVADFKIGDLVACAGAGYANHAELVSIPVNLCVKVCSSTNLKHAAYNTLGAISMQGVRQADLRVGEFALVLGLGLLGQLTGLILKASGVHVIGVDLSESAVQTAIQNNAVDEAYSRSHPGLEEIVLNQTSGFGVDSTIVTAATSSLDPINFSGAITRKKGNVVVLGAVPTGFDRDPHWYRKELVLKMACSYGPGRYDLNYEEKGVDYPYAYVRWTEKRNMEAFQKLIEKKLIDIDYLTTHEFNFADANRAYDMMMAKSEPFIGIALRYNTSKDHSNLKVTTHLTNKSVAKVALSFIGAGSYAQGNLLPNIPVSDQISRLGVLTQSGTTSKRVAEKYQFEFCTSSESDLFNGITNTVFIATRHDTHAEYVIKALNHGCNVFVEKPICLTEPELNHIGELQVQTGKPVMIGFNRRFSPFIQKIKKTFGSGPMAMIYRINAGSIPADTWIQDREIGGGRIIGEVCHFIDLLTFINGSLPEKLSAIALPDAQGLNDTVNISIHFKNGSIGTVSYFANGSKELPKEYLEVYKFGSTAILDDFKKLTIYSKEKSEKSSVLNQNKGQKEMVTSFFASLLKDGSSPIPMDEIYAVTRSTFRVIQSIQQNGASLEV